MREVRWSVRAQRRFDEIASWYSLNVGEKAAMNFASDVYDVVKTLAHSPGIGISDTRRSSAKTNYFTFLIYPKYRVVYRYTKTRLYIVTLYATMMNR